jgi:NAD(P)H dehydrogenase (quinone)
MAARVAVVYHSATGNVYRLARAVVEGASAAGAETRLRKVGEAPAPAAEGSLPPVRLACEQGCVPEVVLADLLWADALIFGTPTRFGNVSGQLKLFIDSAGPLWVDGLLADKVVSGFVSSTSPHGGQESTLLALYNSFYHWSAIIVPPLSGEPAVRRAGGNPYGTSHVGRSGAPDGITLAAARHQGYRVATVADRLRSGELAAVAAGGSEQTSSQRATGS